jgi:predicted NBD/HSP70 family sugar kinase
MADDRQLRGGIDLGGTKIETIVVDDNNEVLGQARRATPTDGGPAAVAEQMADGMREAAQNARVQTSELIAIGVGSPGDVDEQAGTVGNARNLPDWRTSSGPRCSSVTTSRWRPRPSSSWGPASPTTPCWACSGAPASAVG